MIRPVVIDTGPLVAILRESDEHHKVCVANLRNISKPAFTCWPVITEVAWLLRHQSGGHRALFDLLRTGAVQIVELGDVATWWMEAFLICYSSVRAQLADAAVMYLAESRSATVFTLDRRDFGIYRLSNGKMVPVIPES